MNYSLSRAWFTLVLALMLTILLVLCPSANANPNGNEDNESYGDESMHSEFPSFQAQINK
jgi:hypothetical protein